MTLVSSDMFTAKDLKLFIESVQEIKRLEDLRKQCQQRHRAQYLIKTLRYLDQTFPKGSSCTVSSVDRPEEMQQFEILEAKPIELYLLPNKCDAVKHSLSFEMKLKEVQEMEEEKQDVTVPIRCNNTCSKGVEVQSKEDQSSQGEKQRQKFKLAKYLQALVFKHYKRGFVSKGIGNGC